MHKKLILAILLLFTVGCKTLTVRCVEMSEAQYRTAVRKYGSSNVQMWRMKNDNPYPYTYHMQIKVRVDGLWYWIPNHRYSQPLVQSPQRGCRPFKKVK